MFSCRLFLRSRMGSWVEGTKGETFVGDNCQRGHSKVSIKYEYVPLYIDEEGKENLKLSSPLCIMSVTIKSELNETSNKGQEFLVRIKKYCR